MRPASQRWWRKKKGRSGRHWKDSCLVPVACTQAATGTKPRHQKRRSSFSATRLLQALHQQKAGRDDACGDACGAQRTKCSLEFSRRTIVDFNVLVHYALLLPDAATASSGQAEFGPARGCALCCKKRLSGAGSSCNPTAKPSPRVPTSFTYEYMYCSIPGTS